jgi:beta-glucanase (GH16 family)
MVTVMDRLLQSVLLMPLVAAALASAGAAASSQDRGRAHKQIWADEFDGPAGTRPDAGKWVFDLGYGHNLWGNHEYQTYTDSAENASLDGQGHLVITARRMPDGKYTSARIKTLGRFAQKFGRYEARIRIPRGPGLLPAFWMMGRKGGWPNNGEIDVMENVGGEPRILHSNIHGPGYDATGQYRARADIADDFHIYGIEWSAGSITWSFDGKPFKTTTAKDLPAGKRWIFDDQPFYLILNVAIGGDWPGPPVDRVLPQRMLVDWVRVSQ